MARKKRTDGQDAPPDEAGPLPPDADEGGVVGPAAPEPLAEPDLAPAVDVRIMAAPAAPAPPPPEAVLDERLARLEKALLNLHQIEQRLAIRAPEPPPPSGPTILGGAASLISGAASLVPAALGGPSAKPPATGTFADAVADLRASYLMFVDPRYNLTWLGRLGPLALLAMFFFPYVWVPFSSLPGFGWVVAAVGQLIASYFLFKIAGHEARRYRATAPDLPPSLRL